MAAAHYSRDAEIAANHLIHHSPHCRRITNAELRFELGLSPVPSGPSQRDAFKTGIGNRHDTGPSIRLAHFDGDKTVAFERTEIVSDSRAVHGHQICQLQHRLWPPMFQMPDRKSTRLNSSHANISYAVFC